jgi:hypothetical protein
MCAGSCAPCALARAPLMARDTVPHSSAWLESHPGRMMTLPKTALRPRRRWSLGPVARSPRDRPRGRDYPRPSGRLLAVPRRPPPTATARPCSLPFFSDSPHTGGMITRGTSISRPPPTARPATQISGPPMAARCLSYSLARARLAAPRIRRVLQGASSHPSGRLLPQPPRPPWPSDPELVRRRSRLSRSATSGWPALAPAHVRHRA